MGAMGVHTFVLLGFALAMSTFVVMNARTTEIEAYTVPFTTFLMSFFLAAAEYCMALLFSELQAQLETTGRLLDGATDGFCVIDLATNQMSGVSAQLADTFGCNELDGARLIDFVEHQDKQKVRFNSLGGDGKTSDYDEDDLRPILVTCYRKSTPRAHHTCQFDAQISPYAARHGRLHVFVKVLGARLLHF